PIPVLSRFRYATLFRSDALDVRPGHAGAGDDLVPVGTADVAGEVLPPVGIEGSEVGVGAVFEYPLGQTGEQGDVATDVRLQVLVDRKSTRLNSSHVKIS